jgi:hypothetical protein
MVGVVGVVGVIEINIKKPMLSRKGGRSELSRKLYQCIF